MMIAIDKSALEARIQFLKKQASKAHDINDWQSFNEISARISSYESVLSQGIEVPEAGSWEDVSTYMSEEERNYYPNGIIIKPK